MVVHQLTVKHYDYFPGGLQDVEEADLGLYLSHQAAERRIQANEKVDIDKNKDVYYFWPKRSYHIDEVEVFE